MEKKEVWVIECRTGCTCCSDENFTQGPYLTEDQAVEVKQRYEQGKGNPLASQYAKYGRYAIEKWEIEVLPDGRWIYGGNIFRNTFDIRELLDSDGANMDY